MLGVWYISSALPFLPSPGTRRAGGAKTGGLESESPVEEGDMRDRMDCMPV
jgi:hypothetical protein